MSSETKRIDNIYLKLHNVVQNDRESFYQAAAFDRVEFSIYEAYMMSHVSDLVQKHPELSSKVLQLFKKSLGKFFLDKKYVDFKSSHTFRYSYESSEGINDRLEITTKPINDCIEEYLGKSVGQFKNESQSYLDMRTCSGEWMTFLSESLALYNPTDLQKYTQYISAIIRDVLESYVVVGRKDVDLLFNRLVVMLRDKSGLFDKSKRLPQRVSIVFSGDKNTRFVLRIPPNLGELNY